VDRIEPADEIVDLLDRLEDRLGPGHLRCRGLCPGLSAGKNREDRETEGEPPGRPVTPPGEILVRHDPSPYLAGVSAIQFRSQDWNIRALRPWRMRTLRQFATG